MSGFYAWFWAVLVFSSIIWYTYLLFHVGWRGGRDIITMARELSRQ